MQNSQELAKFASDCKFHKCLCKIRKSLQNLQVFAKFASACKIRKCLQISQVFVIFTRVYKIRQCLQNSQVFAKFANVCKIWSFRIELSKLFEPENHNLMGAFLKQVDAKEGCKKSPCFRQPHEQNLWHF